MKELRFFHGGVRLMSAAGFRAAVALSVVVGGGCAVLGKDVTLTFKAAGTMAEQGVWTVDGQPGAQADLAEGDTLVVKTGSLNGVYVKFDNFTTPRLAAFRCEGTGAVNFCALKLNLRDNGVLDVAQERMILSDGFFLNPGDGEDAMKMVVRTGAGTLQIRVAQPGCFKFRLSAGCNLYLHNDAALGPAYSTTVADALVLEDGASLRNGVANTADRDVTLPSSHGVTIVDGATVSFEAVRGETAASVWSLAVAGPIRGTGVTLKIDGGGAAGQGVALCGANDFSGTLAFDKTLRLASDRAVSKDVALVSEASDAVLELGGRVVTARSLDVAKGFGGVRGPGVLKLDCAFEDLPNVPCVNGAALAVADGREEPRSGTIDVDAGTARALMAASGAVTKTGDGALSLLGTTAGLSSVSVQAGTVALEGLDATPATVTVADGATLRAFGGASIYEFRFSRTVGANRPVCLSEIALTCGGVPLDMSLYADVQVSDGSTDTRNLVDGTGKTFWTSGVCLDGASVVTVRLVLARPVVVDGYLLGTGEAEDGATNPTDWTFVARRLDAERTLDSRTGVELARYPGDGLNWLRRGNFAPRFALSEMANLASVSDATMVMLAEGATCELVGGAATLGALSGAGTLRLAGGAQLTVNDLTGWTGAVRTVDATATLVLGADGIVKTPEAANLVLSAGNAQSIILDGSAGEVPLSGRTTGGTGLVKTGAGTAWVSTEQATATGAVSVVAGRCCVSARRAVSYARSCTARYIRFQPLASVGRSSTYNWELGEFELVDASGARLAWPADTTVTPQYADGLVGGANLINGNYEDRVCSKGAAGASFDDLQYVTIDTQTGVSFAGYAVYPPYNGGNTASYSEDRRRMVKAWRVLVSDDGERFAAYDENSFDPSILPETWAAFAAASPIRIGPFGNPLPTAESGVTTLPAEFLVAADDPLTTCAPALQARYFRFAPYGRKGGDSLLGGDFGLAIGEFDLYRNGTRIAWEGATATSDAAYYQGNAQTAVDNDCANRSYAHTNPFSLTIDAGRVVAFDAYGFHNDSVSAARAPTSWKLFVSADGAMWHEVDARRNVEIRGGASEAEGPWSVAGKWPIPARQNVLGDTAPVTVAAGAELWVSSDGETVGALSGAGLVTLFEQSLLALNSSAAGGAFSGTIGGSGTLALVGTGTQTLDGARLDGVSRLALSGGTLAGRAEIGHDLTLDFAGGSLSASLERIGALTVDGAVAFAVPAGAQEGFTQPLLAWTSIDAASRARLEQATVINGSSLKMRDIEVVVEGRSCFLRHRPQGFAILVR